MCIGFDRLYIGVYIGLICIYTVCIGFDWASIGLYKVFNIQTAKCDNGKCKLALRVGNCIPSMRVGNCTICHAQFALHTLNFLCTAYAFKLALHSLPRIIAPMRVRNCIPHDLRNLI